MGRLTKNFIREEFSCKCGCGFNTIDFAVVTTVQSVVDYYSSGNQRPIYAVITSGCRCESHNKRQPGAAKDSQHLYGKAADFKVGYKNGDGSVDWINADDVVGTIRALSFVWGVSIGVYESQIHVDVRDGGVAFWDERE
jgi:hypothetical protein